MEKFSKNLTRENLQFATKLVETPGTDVDYIVLQVMPYILKKSITIAFIQHNFVSGAINELDFDYKHTNSIVLLYKFCEFSILYKKKRGKSVAPLTEFGIDDTIETECKLCGKTEKCIIKKRAVCKNCVEKLVVIEMKKRTASFVKSKFVHRECMCISRSLQGNTV